VKKQTRCTSRTSGFTAGLKISGGITPKNKLELLHNKITQVLRSEFHTTFIAVCNNSCKNDYAKLIVNDYRNEEKICEFFAQETKCT